MLARRRVFRRTARVALLPKTRRWKMSKATRNAKTKAAATQAGPVAAAPAGAGDVLDPAATVRPDAGSAYASGAGSAGTVAPGVEYQGKPLDPDHQPEAHVDDKAGLSADSGAGDPHMNTPRGSSGTAREASSAGSGVAIDGSATGTQSGSPNPSEDASQAVTEGGGTGASGAGSASAAFADPEAAVNEAYAKYPHLFAASEAWRAASPDAPPTSIQIKSKVEGFRRAGVAHSRAPIDHPIGTFDADQLEALLAEPKLTVRFV